MMVYSNSVRFDTTQFDDDKFIRESTITEVQWNLDKPGKTHSFLHINEVEDETDYFQVGQTQSDTFYSLKVSEIVSSSHNSFPHDYQFIDIEISHHNDKLMINRQTLDILACFGDIGGLVEFVYYIGYFLLLPFTKFTLGSTLLSLFFDERFHKRENKKLSLKDVIKSEFTSFRNFPLHARLRDFCFDKSNLKKKIARSNRMMLK